MSAVETKRHQQQIELIDKALDQGGLLVHRVGKHGEDDNRWIPMDAADVPRALLTISALSKAKNAVVSGAHLENETFARQTWGSNRRVNPNSGRSAEDRAA